ncbi:MAG: bifunctional nuclease family protein [Chitinophagales bacterium]|nr:bifunctional nuclease family protein [Chitinophagales bacterium]
MNKIELEILALSHSVTQSHSFAVILGEVGGSRRLPIVIGGFEAQAIAVALDNMRPSRPLTHDLMKMVCDTFDITLEQVHINKLQEGVFYSNLVCKQNGETYEIDSRTSDALALAVRFSCPIFVEENILREAGVEADPNEEASVEKEIAELAQQPVPSGSSNFSGMTDDELTRQLTAAIEGEDYEKAARIRDEMTKRKK